MKPSIYSLRRRVMVGALLIMMVLSFFVGVALERVFLKTALRAQEEKMSTLLYALLASVSYSAEGKLTINEETLAIPDLFDPDAEISVRVMNQKNEILWSNETRVDTSSEIKVDFKEGEEFQVQVFENKSYFQIFRRVEYVDAEMGRENVGVLVRQSAKSFEREKKDFRTILLSGVALGLFVFLIFLAWMLRLSFMPLEHLREEIKSVREGEKRSIENRYPMEFTSLVQSMNQLLDLEIKRRELHQNMLDDVSHSLKTPIAVLQAHASDARVSEQDRKMIVDQITRMKDSLSHHAIRASRVSRSLFPKPLLVYPVVERVKNALEKAYHEKKFFINNGVHPSFAMSIDESDLMEILGNLLENSVKYGASNIVVTLENSSDEQVLRIQDNGPGFPLEKRDRLLARGKRGDENVEGQGLGLAIVSELLASYRGTMELSSQESGLTVVLRIPLLQSFA